MKTIRKIYLVLGRFILGLFIAFFLIRFVCQMILSPLIDFYSDFDINNPFHLLVLPLSIFLFYIAYKEWAMYMETKKTKKTKTLKISVKLGVSEETKHGTCHFEDLGLTEEEWNEMSDKEKFDAIKQFVFGIPE